MRTDIHAKTRPRPPMVHQFAIDDELRRSLKTRRPEHARLGPLDPLMIVQLARQHTVSAIEKLVELMNGRLPPDMSGLADAQGVPATVQLRAAEVLIERAYGKSPQAILLKGDESANALSAHAIPILERIAQIKAAQSSQGTVVDLEASQQVDTTNATTDAGLQDPDDII